MGICDEELSWLVEQLEYGSYLCFLSCYTAKSEKSMSEAKELSSTAAASSTSARGSGKDIPSSEKGDDEKTEVSKEAKETPKDSGDTAKLSSDSNHSQTPASPPPEPKYDVIGLLEKGCALRYF